MWASKSADESAFSRCFVRGRVLGCLLGFIEPPITEVRRDLGGGFELTNGTIEPVPPRVIRLDDFAPLEKGGIFRVGWFGGLVPIGGIWSIGDALLLVSLRLDLVSLVDGGLEIGFTA